MAFRLSARSRARLAGVHADLVLVVERAITRTRTDFGVSEGVRTPERQTQLYQAGASRTMNSRHLTGHAVDLIAYVGREMRWELNLYYDIAEAMRDAGNHEGVPVEWGGCWQPLSGLTDLPQAVADYVSRCKARGHKPLVDGPHFQLPRRRYPA